MRTGKPTKETLPPGPWSVEPDVEVFKHANYRCVVYRHPSLFHLCGYVGIPKSHPLYGIGYSRPSKHLERKLKKLKKAKSFEWSMPRGLAALFGGDLAPTPEIVFDVHGGVTYAGESFQPIQSPVKTLWFFGFDCAHAGDLSPSSQYWFGDERSAPNWETYRDVGYVKKECARLADQLRALA